MNINELIAHGFLDAIIAVFLFVVGIMVKSLRDALGNMSRNSEGMAKSISDLSLVVGRDYLTRTEHRAEINEIYGRLDRIIDKLDTVAIGLAKAEPHV